MKRSTKAALLSALVFPGLGQFLLRRHVRGCLFLLIMALAVFVLGHHVLALADAIVAELNSGALPFDPVAITARIEAGDAGQSSASVASWIALLCWLASVADALWLGRQESPSTTPPKETP